MKKRNDSLTRVWHASERAAVGVHFEMKRGLNGLACIATVAPMLGFLATVRGVVGSFKGLSGDEHIAAIYMAREIAESLAPTAFGLIVAILAYLGYRYLCDKLEIIDIEMKNISVELVDELARLS